MFASVGETGSERGYTVGFSVLGCSDPLTVRSVAFCLLAPASGSAKDLALLRCAAWIPLPYNSRLPLRFTPWKKPVQYTFWNFRDTFLMVQAFGAYEALLVCPNSP